MISEQIALSIPKTAARLGVSAATVRRMLIAGQLPELWIRGRRMVPTAALERSVEENTRGGSDLASAAMGIGTESQILNQAKKGQGETNDRLDALLAEMKQTNVLLAELLSALSGRT